MSFQQSCSRLARRQKILAGSAVVIVATGYLFGYRPMAVSYAATVEQNRTISQDLIDASSRAANLDAVEREVTTMRQRLSRFKSLDDTGNISALYAEITEKASACNVTYDVKPSSARKNNELFAEHNVEINLDGDFVNVLSFISQLEASPRLMRVAKLNITPVDSATGRVKARMTVAVYYRGTHS